MRTLLRSSPTLVGVLAVVLWSGTVALFRSISEMLGSVAGPALIFSVGGLLAAPASGMPKLKAFPRAYLWIGGALFVTYEVALALAIGFAANREQAIELGMINYLWPSLTVLLAVMSGQQRGSWLLIPSMVLCLAGIMLVMKGERGMSFVALWQNMQSNPEAYALAFYAALAWAVYTVFTRSFGGGINGVPLFLLATAVVLWVQYATGPSPALHLTANALLQVLVMGSLMAAAYSFWNHGIQHGNISVLATASYFTPILSVAIASVWLDVRLSLAFQIGVVLVTVGSLTAWLSTRSSRRI